MKIRSLFAVLTLALTCTALPVRAQPASPRVAWLNYQTRTLANGLTVYSLENHGSPTVAIQVWYKVGSKDDPPGRSGFAHLFEHIMFKSTRNMKAETMDRLTEDVGGENNAYTASDVTVYHETVPSNYLETLLWAEADRMANLNVDEANFRSERLVVEEEFRSSVLAEPYGRLYELLIPQRSYQQPAYHRSTIGSISDLDSATLDDVRRFHATYYRPDNAVLVVVGDFDVAKMNAWVDRYFGRIARPTTPIPHVETAEPARTAAQAYRETAPGVPLPSLTFTYLTPGVGDADAPALRVADSILSGGASSRLYHALVYGQRVASEVSTDADLHAQVGLFTAQAVAASGASLDTVRKSLTAEIERIQTAPPTAAELTRARNQLLTGVLEGRETVEGLASALGDAAVLQGDPEFVNTQVARLAAVTGADVQRVAAKYFTDANRVEIRYSAGPDSLGIKPSTAAAVTEQPQVAGANESAAAGATEKPPLPATPRSVAFPSPVERKLANGLRVIVVSKPGTGLVTANLVLKNAGSAGEADVRAGLAEFTAGLLTRGTTTRSASAIASSIESLGTSIDANAGWDSAAVGTTALRENLPPALAILRDVATRPAFAPEEIARLRSERLDDVSVSLESPGTVARLAAARLVFGTLPYGHPASGTAHSLRRLTRADVRDFHGQHFRPSQAILVFGGDITPDTAFALAQHQFGDWKPETHPTPAAGRIGATATAGTVRGGTYVLDKPEAGQAAVIISQRSIARADPDYYAATVANAVLGGGYSARLNEEIRIKRGLSYGAGSRVAARRDVGPFTASAQTKNASAAQVAALMLHEMGRLSTEPVRPAELTTRVASLAGAYARELETGGGLAAQVGTLAALDRPLGELSDYLPRIQAVTPDAIRRFAADKWSTGVSDVVIVGDAKQFLPELRQRVRKPIKVIPVAKFDGEGMP